MRDVNLKLGIAMTLMVVLLQMGCNGVATSSMENSITGMESIFKRQINIKSLLLNDSFFQQKIVDPTIIPKSMKEGKLLATVIENQDIAENRRRVFFLVYDTRRNKIEAVVEKFYSGLSFEAEQFDYDNGKFFFCNDSHANWIYVYSVQTKVTDSIAVPIEYRSFLGKPIVDSSTIFFSGSPLGSAAYQMGSNRWLSLRSQHSQTINYVYSTVSIPQSGENAVISGKRKGKEVVCYIIDSALSKIDSFSMEENFLALKGQLKILRLSEGYLVVNPEEVSVFGGNPLHLKSRVSVEKNLSNAFLISNDTVLYMSSYGNLARLHLVQISKGKEIWAIDFGIHIHVNCDVIVNKNEKKIVVFDAGTMKQYDFNGTIVSVTNARDFKGFYNLEDLKTGELYAVSTDGSYLMW